MRYGGMSSDEFERTDEDELVAQANAVEKLRRRDEETLILIAGEVTKAIVRSNSARGF